MTLREPTATCRGHPEPTDDIGVTLGAVPSGGLDKGVTTSCSTPTPTPIPDPATAGLSLSLASPFPGGHAVGIAPSVAFSDGLLSLTFRNFQLLKLVCNKLRKCHSKNVLRDLSWLALYYRRSAFRPARAAGRSGVALHPAGRSERRRVSHREPWEELEVGGGTGALLP